MTPITTEKDNDINTVIIILDLPPVACQSNRPLPADGDAVSRCQVLGRAGSVRHEAGLSTSRPWESDI